MVELLIKKRACHRRKRQPRIPRNRYRRGRARLHSPRRCPAGRGRPCHRRNRPRRLPRLYRPALARRPDHSGRASSRSQGTAGRHHRACGYRRNLPRPVQEPGRVTPLHMARRWPELVSAHARRLAHRRRTTQQVRQQGRHQHRLHSGQLAGAHLGGRAGTNVPRQTWSLRT